MGRQEGLPVCDLPEWRGEFGVKKCELSELSELSRYWSLPAWVMDVPFASGWRQISDPADDRQMELRPYLEAEFAV
jgi:hypothetical protein